MFTRTLTAPQALRYYADSRTKSARLIAYDMGMARQNYGLDRTWHAEDVISTAAKREKLLIFLLAHADALPTDAETIAVLRQDLEIMRSHIKTARWLIANPWA